MKYLSLVFILSIPFFYSCQEKASQISEESSSSTLIYSSSHFSIEKEDYYTIITVNTPFVGADIVERYVLYPEDSLKPKIEETTHYFTTPLKAVAINSTTHLGFIEALSRENEIKAASNLNLYFSSVFQARIKEGKVNSIGNRQLDVEQLINNNCSVLFSFAIDASGYQEAKRLRELGQKVVLIAEFMENDPMNKAAWLKVFAEFFEVSNEADLLLGQIEKEYGRVQKLANAALDQPKVMVGLPWKGSWYVSGGSSFQANYFEAAHSNYIWRDKKQEGGLPLTFEKVIQDALDSEYWLNPGAVASKEDLMAKDSRFQEFEPFKRNTIYTNYKRSNSSGGNDYWESAVVRADLVLSDLVAIFHPELLPNYELYYYQNLAEVGKE